MFKSHLAALEAVEKVAQSQPSWLRFVQETAGVCSSNVDRRHTDRLRAFRGKNIKVIDRRRVQRNQKLTVGAKGGVCQRIPLDQSMDAVTS